MNRKGILMPKLGESVTEGTINSWLIKEGDYVNKYDPIADVMTDKVNAEVPSSFSGTIKEIVVAEGETVPVGELICYVDVEADANSPQDEPTEEKAEIVVEETKNKDISMHNRFSPAVFKLAGENNIDLTVVEGTGLGGRITRKDIEIIIKSGVTPVKPTDQTEIPKPTQSPKVHSHGKDIEIPVTGVRKIIAENMVRSKTEIPHAWMTVEVDVTDLVNYRKSIKDEFKQREGYNLTYFAFFVNAVAKALKEFPALNSTWAGNKIIQRNNINISIAVAKDNELFVPVIRNADENSIKGIAKAIHDLAQKARTNKLTAEDMSDGTFTVNNTGSFGSISSMGVINHPQAAILQVESIVKRPVIINDMFAARDIVNLSLSLDHRILDGVVCGNFLAHVKNTLENTNEMTTNVY